MYTQGPTYDILEHVLISALTVLPTDESDTGCNRIATSSTKPLQNGSWKFAGIPPPGGEVGGTLGVAFSHTSFASIGFTSGTSDYHV